jgi:hypothetical protein
VIELNYDYEIEKLKDQIKLLSDTREIQWKKYDDLKDRVDRLFWMCIGAGGVILALIDVPELVGKLIRASNG